MKFFSIFLLPALMLLLTGCPKRNDSGKLKVAAGLPPVAGLVATIGGDRIEVISVLPEGKTPHDFTPRNETVRQTFGTKLFLTTGMPFENKISDFVKQRTEVCDVSAGINRIAFDNGENEDHHHHSGCSHDEHDPHVWLSPANAEKIAENICTALIKIDPDGAEYYRKNFTSLKERLSQLDASFKTKLAPYSGRSFFVYHPAFGYFADAYGLKQRAIELNGREASPADLAKIIKEAKAANVTSIFVQEQFNPRNAEALAKEINGKVVPFDPLAQDLPGNLEKIADSIADGFKAEKR